MPRKALVFAGLTGVGVGGFIEEAVRYLKAQGVDSVFGAKFEDYLKVEMGLADLESVAFQILSASRTAVRERFASALERLLGDAGDSEVLVVGVHLTYHSRGVLAANPILGDLLSLAPETALVYLVEDYYDALYRIARRWVSKSARASGETVFASYQLDPLTYLYWRGAEMSLVNAVRSFRRGLRVFLLGVKHPPSVLHAIVDDFVLGRCVIHTYISHPITVFRALRLAAEKPVKLVDVPGVRDIEEVADSLESLEPAAPDGRHCRITVYRPTTIDELIVAPTRVVAERLGCSSPAPDTLTLDPAVSAFNRWPFKGFHNDYKHVKGVLDIVRDEYMQAAFSNAVRALREELCGGGGLVSNLMLSMVRAQIEMRDYSYVEQSRVVAAVAPVFYEVTGGGNGCLVRAHVALTEGVEAEVRRAHALAKRLVVILLPVDLNSVIDALCDSRECGERVRRVVESSSRVRVDVDVDVDNGGCGSGRVVGQALLRVAERLLVGSGRERPLSPLGVVDGIAVVADIARSLDALAKLFLT